MPPLYPKPFFLKAFSLLLVAISGCASLPETPDWRDTEFTVAGRMGVRDGTESFSSSFSWAQRKDGYHIELWGPLGQGRTRLVGTTESVTVYAPNGDVHVEDDTVLALRRWLGFSLPIEALTRWIRGQAALEFAIDELVRDDHGDLVELSQLDWNLVFSRYRELADGNRVPGRIVANRATVRVTLVPKDWAFSPTFQ